MCSSIFLQNCWSTWSYTVHTNVVYYPFPPVVFLVKTLLAAFPFLKGSRCSMNTRGTEGAGAHCANTPIPYTYNCPWENQVRVQGHIPILSYLISLPFISCLSLHYTNRAKRPLSSSQCCLDTVLRFWDDLRPDLNHKFTVWCLSHCTQVSDG